MSLRSSIASAIEATLAQCTISNCHAVGAYSIGGGGIYISGGGCKVQLSDTAIVGCSVSAIKDGFLHSKTGNVWAGNQAEADAEGMGGGLAVASGDLVLKNLTRLAGNTASGSGNTLMSSGGRSAYYLPATAGATGM